MRAKKNIYQYEKGGRFPSNHLGERMYGQETSEIRKDEKGTFVWYAGDADGLPSGSSDQEWKDRGAVKVYGDFSKYSNSRSPFIHDDHDYIIRPTGDGSYELDEEQTQAQAGMEDGFNMAEEVQYTDKGTTKDLLERLNAFNRSNRGVTPGRAEREMAGEARGGMGASATEDLLERLTQYKLNAYGNKYEQGGSVKKKDSTKKLAGQYFSPIASDENYRDYVLYIPDYEGDITNMIDTDFRKLEMAGAKRIYLPTDERGQAVDRRISTVNVNGRAMLADEDFRISEIGGKSVLVPAYDQGGKVNGGTIKIAGQYAVDSIKTTPEGKQYVSMELPDGKVVPVFGDWETYGNPDREGRIEDLDFRIYPLGDGTYALDAAEAEAEMLRAESREVSRQAGSNVEDLLQELNQRGGMGFTPQGRMRPVKKQR